MLGGKFINCIHFFYLLHDIKTFRNIVNNYTNKVDGDHKANTISHMLCLVANDCIF